MARTLDDMPFISVIISAYNVERYLGRCLDSVFAQGYRAFGVIAIDDGSTDGFRVILDACRNQHAGQMTYITQENEGAASACNRGIELATGDYLCFVDDDDYLDIVFLSTYVRHMGDCVDAVCGGCRWPCCDGSIVLEVVANPEDEWAPFAVEAAWAKLYRTNFVFLVCVLFLMVASLVFVAALSKQSLLNQEADSRSLASESRA